MTSKFKTISKQFMSLMLVLVTLFSLIPVGLIDIAHADLVDNAGGGGLGGGSGKGTYMPDQNGYRIYIIDRKTGQQVSNPVDFVYSWPTGEFERGAIFFNTKLQSPGDSVSKVRAFADWSNETYLISQVDQIGEFDSPWSNQPPMTENRPFRGLGNEFRQWFTHNTELKGSGGGGYTGGKYQGNNSSTNKRPITGNSGTNTGGSGNTGNSGNNSDSDNNGGSTTKPETPSNSGLAAVSKIRQEMNNTFKLYKASGKFTKTQAINAAVKKGQSLYNNFYCQFIYSDLDLKLMAATITEMVDQFDKDDIGWPSRGGGFGSNPDKVGGGGLKTSSASNLINTPTTTMNIKSNGLFDIAYAKEDKASILEGLFDIAYADDKKIEPQDTNAAKVLDLKVNGNFVFKFNNGITLSKVKITKPDGTVEYKESVFETCMQNNYMIGVEAIFWFRPQRLSSTQKVDDDGNKYYPIASDYSYWFYGTATNYGQLMESISWNDGGGWSNYGIMLNTTGAIALHTPEDTTLLDGSVLFKAESDSGKRYSNAELANTKRGLDLHIYYCGTDGSTGVPIIPTYDPKPTAPKPNKTPHPPEDPDPNIPNGIPLVPGEPEEPGQPITPENPNPEEIGYLNTTRLTHIVKVYDIEHIDGTREHVTTTRRDNCPDIVDIQHEPDYKVIGWFTSPDFCGDLYGWDVDIPDWLGIDSGIKVEDTEWELLINDTEIHRTEEAGEFEWNTVKDKKEGTSVSGFDSQGGTVHVAVGCNCSEDKLHPENGKHYNDNTVYVHLLKKDKIPETSTWDGNPPGDTPPPDPFKDPQTDPETTPDIDPENPYLNHEIVKVYQVKDWSNWQDGMPEPEWEHVSTYYQYPTAPIVTVENEKDYQLTEWKAAWGIPNPTDKTPPEDIITPQVTGSTDWEDAPIKNVSPFKSGVQPAKVEIFDKNNPKKSSTIYVLLRKEIPPEPPGDGAIIIQQSQITKTVRTNDIKIANKMASMNWGNYSFHYQIGDFADPPHSFSHPHYPTGRHSCTHTPNDRWVDNELNLWFHQLTAKQDIQVPDGKFNKTDNAVYSGNSNKGIIHKHDEDITKLSGMNLYDYVSDGKSEKGEELVTVLWRQGLNDKPILAKYKEKDITSGNGYILKGVSATNWTDSLAIVDKADRKAGGQRALDNGFELTDLNFTFGLQQGEGDQQGTSECRGCTCHGCHAPIQNTKYLEVRSGNWAEDFLAVVCVRTYKGRDKAIAAQPNGMGASPQKDIKVTPGKHVANNIIQGKQTIKFYPYIRMTYMINNLDDATKEAQNTDSTGYKQDVRKDTYVISEYESGILPNDAVTVGWENPKDGESLLLTSQQWSVHKKATSQVSGVTTSGWQGKNQVLPGGAIYQLSTPDGSRTTVNLTTYQTVVDEKARAEYLTSTSTLTGDEYTVKKVTEDHLSFVNDAKEILDNLKIVQWVHNPGTSGGNKFSSNDKAYPNNFDETANGYICLFHNGNPRDDAQTSLSQLDNKLTRKPSTDSKYYMHAANVVTEKNGKLSNTGTLADYQNSTKLSDITSTIIKNDAKQSEPTQGDLDITKIHQETTVYKVFTDTSGNVYMISDKRSGASHIDQVEADINAMIASMKDINADTYDKWSGKKEILAAKDIAAKSINGVLTNDAKEIDDRTSFITNIALSVIRNSGTDKTAEWVNGPTEGRWYNEGFDGIYLVKQYTKMEVAFAFTDKRSSALDPALCPQNKGQSDLYTSAFLSQFCVDSQSEAAIAQGKVKNYIGTFKDTDITMPDMESMYVSKKFWIPNANVQDLN